MTISERTVGDLMSRDVLCLSESMDLSHIDDAMRLFKFRHMPVTDDGRLVGVVTQRDVLRVCASSLLPNAAEQTAHLTKSYCVRDIMTRDVKTTRPGAPLAEAAKILIHDKIGCLPVVDESNVVVGIVTDSDFVRLALAALETP
jgi:CBS-domain-containing membrane protein